jgi:hypothetical protein
MYAYMYIHIYAGDKRHGAGKLTEGDLTYDVLYQEGEMVAYGKGGRTINGRTQCTSILVDCEVVGLKIEIKRNGGIWQDHQRP